MTTELASHKTKFFKKFWDYVIVFFLFFWGYEDGKGQNFNFFLLKKATLIFRE